MRKISYFCDRCGKEVTAGLVQIGYRTIDMVTGDPEDYEFGAELCVDCFQLIDKGTADAIKNKPVVVKKRQAANKRDIDMPKVMALRNAGWSFEKIADEFSCSTQTIINHLRAWEANEGKEAGDAEVD